MIPRDKKGHFIKGYKYTDEMKQKRSEQMIGNRHWDNPVCKGNLFKEGHDSYRKKKDPFKKVCNKCGKDFDTDIERQKYCGPECYWKSLEDKKGEKCPFYGKKHSIEAREKIKIKNTGRNVSDKTRQKMSKAQKKVWENNHEDREGRFVKSMKATYDKKGRKNHKRYIHVRDKKYIEWRKAVFERDDYACQGKDCDRKRGDYIEAHHIKSWSEHEELRYEVSNGLTLCKECHKKTDNYCNKK